MRLNLPKHGFATVTTPSFLPGTMVLIYSFLKTNPWFDGDLAIILDKEQFQESELDLLRTFKNLRLVQVSDALKKVVQKVLMQRPDMKSRISRFYSLDSFGLDGYEKLLFCDSDMLFLDNVQELFLRQETLLCCGDGPYYQGLVRDKKTFQARLSIKRSQEISDPFNAGFMLVGSPLLSEETATGLYDLMGSVDWRCNDYAHTDQLVLNNYFSGVQTIVGPEYNYLLAHNNSIESASFECGGDIKVCHFNGPNKPWDIRRALLCTHENMWNYDLFRQWNKRYNQLLGELHLKGFYDP